MLCSASKDSDALLRLEGLGAYCVGFASMIIAYCVGFASMITAYCVGFASMIIAYISRGSCYEFSPCSAFGELGADNELILMSAKLREQLLKACLITFKERPAGPNLSYRVFFQWAQNNRAD